MKEKKITKEQWIQAAYEHFVKRCKSEPSQDEKGGLLDWAKALGDSDYIDEGYAPDEAVDEELSYAD